MKYKRLTTKGKDENWQVWEDDFSHPFEALQTAIDKLAKLENQLENGTLIELPCKVGDTVYNIYKECSKCQHFKDYAYTDYVECTLDDDKRMFDFDFDKDCIYTIYETQFTYSMIDKVGKSIFSTKSEAEKKLKELKEV